MISKTCANYVICIWVETLELIGFITIRGSEGYWAYDRLYNILAIYRATHIPMKL